MSEASDFRNFGQSYRTARSARSCRTAGRSVLAKNCRLRREQPRGAHLVLHRG